MRRIKKSFKKIGGKKMDVSIKNIKNRFNHVSAKEFVEAVKKNSAELYSSHNSELNVLHTHQGNFAYLRMNEAGMKVLEELEELK